MTSAVKTKQFGLDVIFRHDYDRAGKEIAQYTRQSCQYFKEFIENTPHHEEFETFLDIGCGGVTAIDFFAERFISRGIDLYPSGQDPRILKGDFYSLGDIIKEPVDLIFCNHTLEHSLAPLLLEQIRKCHKVGGALFIAVPDADYSWAYDMTSSTTHWSIFNADFLRCLVSRFGYECFVSKKMFRPNKGELFLVGVRRF